MSTAPTFIADEASRMPEVYETVERAPSPGMTWLADNAGWLWFTARRYARSVTRGILRVDHAMKDELFSHMTDRADGVYATWDPALGAGLNHHMRVNLRWYAFKQANKLKLAAGQALDIRDVLHGAGQEGGEARFIEVFDAGGQLARLASELSERELRILAWRDAEDMTFEQVAAELGVCRNVARRMYGEALDRARELLGVGRST